MIPTRLTSPVSRFIFSTCIMLCLAASVSAELPAALRDIGIDQKLSQQIPPDLTFRDETGRSVRLGDYFNSRKPLVLTLVYFKCPMLCTLVLNDTLSSFRALSELSVGRDFDVLTVSFDPREGPDLASRKKANYIAAYRRDGAQSGWHFLTGDEKAIRALTQAVGFRYRYDPEHDQFIHPGGLIVLTPEGKISRYFYGVAYAPKDLRLALVEASHSRIGSIAEQILLFCFQYDVTSGKYTLAVFKALRIAAALTLVGLATFLFVMFRRERNPKPIDP